MQTQTGVRAARRLAGPLILLFIAIAVYWKLVLSGGQYTWLNSPDLSTQVLPWFQLQAREWNRGQLPLWDLYNWGGQSLIGRTEPGVVYPLNWILFRLPLDNGFVSPTYLNWYYVLTHYLGALFCYFLCRDLGRSVRASILAGTLFGLGGYVGTTGWPQMVNGAIWGPLVVMFFLRAMRGDRPYRNMALSGGFLGVSLLSGHHQAPTFIALVIVGLWLYYLLSTRRFWGLVLLGVVFGCFVFLLGAAQLLPSIEYGKLSVRWVGAQNDPIGWNEKVPYNVHHWLSMNPVWVLAVVLPGVHRHPTFFCGLVAVALALIAVTTMWVQKEVRLFGAVAIGGLLFALGSASIFHGLMYALVPAVEKARNPSMAVYIFQFGVAVLAAFGLDALGETRWRAYPFTGRLVAGLWTLSAVVYVALLAGFVAWEDKVFLHWRLATAPVAGLLAGAALLAWKRGALSARAAQASLLLVLFFELGNSTGSDFFHRLQGWDHLDKRSQNLDILEFLRRPGGIFRVHIDRAEIPFNFGQWREIEECEGNSGVTANLHRVSGVFNAHMLIGERFYVGRKPIWPEQVEVFQSPGGIKVYENPHPFPRAWSVHEVTGIADQSEIIPNLVRPLEELRQRAFVAGTPPRVDACDAADEVYFLGHRRSPLQIYARMRCKGMVVVAGTWFPGWEATVDGKKVPIYEAYGFLRGVVVEAGEHDITMRYRPRSVFWGAVLTISGALALVVVVSRGRGRGSV